MKTFFAFLLGMFITAGAIVLYKEAPYIIKNWDNKPDVSVNDSTTDDSITTTDDSATTTNESTTDDNATVQSNDSTYDDSTYNDEGTYDDSAYNESTYNDSTYDDSANVDLPPLPPLPINNELNALHNLRSICHQLQDIDRAVNEYPVLSPCP